ncbi:MAG: nucleotidyltransferase domain-containing protein [archaeon]|nr:nucleotidyltransferase domain-containing protein [archaeon]
MILQKCSIWNVAEVFFIEPTKVHFIKEISKKINLAHTSVKNHLLTLIDLGFIEKVHSEPFNGYKAKRDGAEFIFYKKISNVIQLKESGLINTLKEKYPRSIILFGSYDKGEDIESSDLDIFLDSKKFQIDEKKFEKYLKRNIHLIFKDEISKSLKSSINQGTLLFGER